MAAKDVYKIPSDLNASYADMEISVNTKDGIGRPIAVKTVLTWIGAFVLCVFLVSKTFIGQGYIFQIVLFVVFYVSLVILLCKPDATQRMCVALVPVMVNYLPRASREVVVRTGNRANEFWGMTGIMAIHDNGLVEYTDGTWAYWYRVVGSASILLFDDDRRAILERVDRFYQKMSTEVEISFLTAKESQKVYRQLNALQKRYDKLKISDELGDIDPDLKMIAEEQFKILKNYVGKEFRSIHQYMIIKAENKEALTTFKNILQSEVENSSLMIKQCVALYPEDINEVLRTIYAHGSLI